MKYLLITLEIQDGERRHTHRVLHTTTGKNIEFSAERYASTYWGYGTHSDDWWWVDGEIAIRVKLVKELSVYEYKLMSELMSETHTLSKPTFEIVHAGYRRESGREEVQIHYGEHGNIFLIKTDEGFIVDVYGHDDVVSTMTVWDDDLAPEEDAPENFSMVELEDFKDEWGQTHDEICAELGYDEEDSSELLIGDYFWIEADQKWYPKCASTYSEREQAIADYLRA